MKKSFDRCDKIVGYETDEKTGEQAEVTCDAEAPYRNTTGAEIHCRCADHLDHIQADPTTGQSFNPALV